MATLTEATKEDADIISRFLSDMIIEVGEFPPESVDAVARAVNASFAENIQWFLFHDENRHPFGTCYCQPVFNYWTTQKRFHFGAFYIAPSFRGKDLTQDLYRQLKLWAQAHNGYSLFCFIHEDNERSRKAFSKAGCDLLPEIAVFNDRLF